MNQSTNIKTPEFCRRVVGKQQSTLKSLRALQPNRLLTWTESKAIAARQASRLRNQHEPYGQLPFDTALIADQPRIKIDIDDRISVAGSSHWTGSHWQILLNADDTLARQRFTLAHEYKHIIDHGQPVAPDLEERICDHFAACLLMPKPLVIAAWTDPAVPQTVSAMATLFVVSLAAMKYRLNDLGLLERSKGRCARPRSSGIYSPQTFSGKHTSATVAWRSA